MSPVVSLMLLAFMLLIGFSLTVWAALTLRDGRRAPGADEAREHAPSRPSEAHATNDAVRGARAPRKHPPTDAELPLRPAAQVEGSRPVKPPLRPRAKSDEDPFERFLRERSGGDDLDF